MVVEDLSRDRDVADAADERPLGEGLGVVLGDQVEDPAAQFVGA